MKNEDTARALLDRMVEHGNEDDIRAAVVAYALLAIADAINDLGAEVEKLGWAARKA